MNEDWANLLRNYRWVVGTNVTIVAFLLIFRRQLGYLIENSFGGLKAMRRSPVDQIVAATEAAAATGDMKLEKLYRLIFGSQVKALRASLIPVPLQDIEDIFLWAQSHFPKAHSSRTFETWARFLVEAGLGVEQPGGHMAATTVLGQQLLAYMARKGYPDPWG